MRRFLGAGLYIRTLIVIIFLVLFWWITPQIAFAQEVPWCGPTQSGACVPEVLMCPASGPWHPSWNVQCVDTMGPEGSSHYCCEVAPAPTPTPAPFCSSNADCLDTNPCTTDYCLGETV